VTQTRDRWYRWLCEDRHGGDPAQQELVRQTLYPVRDQVLDRASLGPSDTLLDVGTGDGLIAFGALDRLGPAGRVIFSDISADVLGYCRAAVADAGELGRSDFVQASADKLDGVADASVDVLTTRSVLIYVADKAAAFAEFRRVLRPGGRISIFEPINTLMQECSARLFYGYDVGPVAELAAKVDARFAAIQPLAANPMLDFDDRDLVRLAEQAGFDDVRLDLQVTVRHSRPALAWETFVRTSPNPNVPPLAIVFDEALTPSELAAFTAHLRPLVELGDGTQRLAVAYLTAGHTNAPRRPIS
jgi:ubiquinone/menaquinone biosynthesis C-methylase UbiE